MCWTHTANNVGQEKPQISVRQVFKKKLFLWTGSQKWKTTSCWQHLHKNCIIRNKGSNQFFILNSLIFYFSNQTHRVRWPRRPWAHPHPTEECTRLCLAQLPWGPPALFTLPSARWVRPWTAWHHPSPSSARQWAPTPWTRLAWATAQVSARRWGLWQTHKYADGHTRFRKYIHRKCIFRHCVFKVTSLWQHRVDINNIYFSTSVDTWELTTSDLL